ncbi:MAG: hypothetical protein FWF69_08065 [Firmicutes bacterium]|nr:hypothetical protein [Bacillota bacterium]
METGVTLTSRLLTPRDRRVQREEAYALGLPQSFCRMHAKDAINAGVRAFYDRTIV